MNRANSNPPKSAIWFLRHACPGDYEALEGDLIERLREGQPRGWFWRQVLIVFMVSVLREIPRHWPHFCYAIAGTLLGLFFWDAPALRQVPDWLHWRDIPWPWSQIAFENSRPALLALAALPILAVGLMIERSFRWAGLLRTAVLNLALITFGHYSHDLFPWLLRTVPGDPYYRKFLILPAVVWITLFFLSFLVTAWVFCPSGSVKREATHPREAGGTIPMSRA